MIEFILIILAGGGGVYLFGSFLPRYMQYLGRQFGHGLGEYINDYLDTQYKDYDQFMNIKPERRNEHG